MRWLIPILLCLPAPALAQDDEALALSERDRAEAEYSRCLGDSVARRIERRPSEQTAMLVAAAEHDCLNQRERVRLQVEIWCLHNRGCDNGSALAQRWVDDARRRVIAETLDYREFLDRAS